LLPVHRRLHYPDLAGPRPRDGVVDLDLRADGRPGGMADGRVRFHDPDDCHPAHPARLRPVHSEERTAMKDASSPLLKAYVGLVLLFLALPVIIVIPAAFNTVPTLSFPPKGFSMQWFATAWNHQPFWDALWVSLAI